MQIITKLMAVLGAFGLTGGVAAAIAYWLFHVLGKGWLDSHFQRDLETLKAEHQREAERFKADLGRYADRAAKFHEREYEVLPEVWGKMNKAFGAIYYVIASLQEREDLSGMTETELDSWLERSDLDVVQKSKIKESLDKNKEYGRILTWSQINDADKALIDFNNYFIMQDIFIDENIAVQISESAKIMRSALISRKMAERMNGILSHGQTDFWSKSLEDIQSVEKIMKNIKILVKQRLSDIKLSSSLN